MFHITVILFYFYSLKYFHYYQTRKTFCNVSFTDSQYLIELQKNFIKHVQKRKIDILNFAETQPAKIIRNTTIVSVDSAGMAC